MMRSLSSGVAGLRTHQTRMDVIGNNIANVNTYGFKSSRATFADVYYQNLSGASSAGTQTGGMNPTQIGYGSAVATIDIMQGVAGNTSTDRQLDVYIAGDGFLVSKDAAGTFKYTRLGNLGFDAAGNLVDANGNFVQGFPMNADGTPNINADGTVLGGALQGIKVDPAILDKLSNITISNSGAIVGMLPGDTTLELSPMNPSWINAATTTIPTESNYRGDVTLAISGYANSALFNTALGASNVVSSVEMGNMALPEGDYSIAVIGGEVTMSFTGTSVASAVTLTGTLDKNGQVVLRQKGSSSNVGLVLNMDPKVTTLANFPAQVAGSTVVNYSTVKMELCVQLTTFDKGGNTVKLYGQNGRNEPVKLSALVPSGSTVSSITFGDIRLGLNALPNPMTPINQKIGLAGSEESSVLVLGNLVLAKFRNASGLQQSGTSAFEETSNSGGASYVLPGLDGTGQISAGYLEMSNVDLSKEFTEMITTQRGFQANSRIITVSDSMLEELVNLKR